MLKYAQAFKDSIEYVLLTDGLQWYFYDFNKDLQFAKMEPHQRFDLSSKSLNEKIRFSLFMLEKIDAAHYWSPELTVDLSQAINKLEDELKSIKKEFNSLRKTLKLPLNTVFDLEKNKDNGLIFIGLNEIEKKMPDTGKPSHFRLPDGEVVAIKTWKAVLLESCKYVLSKVENLQLPLVDKAGKSTLLISEIKPSEKVSFIETSYQDKTVYIYLNYAASRCIANAAYVLQEFLPEGQKALPAVVIA